MKHLLAVATFAALIAAVPANAQVAYGATPGENAAAGFAPSGNWRDSVVIYAEGPDSILLDRLVAPIAAAAPSAAAPASPAFDVRAGGSAGTTGLGGVATDATTVVPEPAIWAMMLMGFGALGSVMRTRKAERRFA